MFGFCCCCIEFALWNGIVSTGSTRMTAGNAAHSQPATLHQTVLLDRLQCILRATRRVPASRRHPLRSSLIESYEEDADSAAHRFVTSARIATRSSRISVNGAEAPLGAITTTKSSDGRMREASFRRASRNLRLARLRWGFDPIAFAMAHPIFPVPARK